MLEVTILEGINDSAEAAKHLAEFCQPLLESVPGIKLVVNLIPWNDIDAETGPASQYKQPSLQTVRSFQKSFMDAAAKLKSDSNHKRNLMCFIRATRGDDEHSACGQLATKKPFKSE
jgi:23S rRNA (adenine2503-C2)-methyltransferase